MGGEDLIVYVGRHRDEAALVNPFDSNNDMNDNTFECNGADGEIVLFYDIVYTSIDTKKHLVVF